MRFAQTIEFATHRIDVVNAELDAWKARTESDRTPHRVSIWRDRDRPGGYLLVVQFRSRQSAMANSSRPETAEFAAVLRAASDRPLAFRNLDVLREEDF